MDTPVKHVLFLLINIHAVTCGSQCGHANLTLEARVAALEVDLLRMEYRGKLQASILDMARSSTPAALGRNPCVLGTNYQFLEFPGRYGEGVPIAKPGISTAQGCLDACRRHHGCVAASVSSGPKKSCHVYTSLPAHISKSSEWNYYVLDHSSSCVVGKPTIEFQAALCSSKSYSTNQRVMWDVVVANVGGGFRKDDGAFHCPVQGIYAFTVNLVPNPSSGCKDYARYQLKDGNGVSVAETFGHTCSWTAATNTVYRECGPGDNIHLHSMKANNALYGECTNKYNTNFSGRLVALS